MVVCALPPALREPQMWPTHHMAHAGIGRMIMHLQLNWYWPGMTADIRSLVQSCEISQTSKHKGTQASREQQHLFTRRPWQKVAVDLMGPLPMTPQANKWILVLTDHFTRGQDVLALPDATAPSVARVLHERVFCYPGLPEQMHTDQGMQFETQLLGELFQLWGVEKSHTTPYHPQANGIVERGNRQLGDSLRALLVSREQEEWDVALPQLLRALRAPLIRLPEKLRT